MIVLGHEPLSDSVTENEDTFSAQLSDAVPPPATKSVRLVKRGGISALHVPFTLPGHVITGEVISSMMMVWTHCAVLPHESAI